MRQEVLEKFYEQDVMPALAQALENLETDFQKTKQDMKQEFIDCFRKICVTAERSRTISSSKTGFLSFHVLRTRILNHNYSYPAMSYDKEWYLNNGIMTGELDVSYYYNHYESLWKQLTRESRKYIQQFCEPDIETIMLKLFEPFHEYVVELMRFSLLEALETEEYEALKKESRFEIQSGEYFEPGDLIHIEQIEKNRYEILNTIIQTNDQSCCFQDYRNLDLATLTSEGKDFRYTDFRNCNLQDINFTNSLLMGTKFKNSFMRHANLMVSMIHDARFDYADLTDANLQYCVAFTGKNQANAWKSTGFTGVSFKNSCLNQANFTGATILGGDFEGADLTGAVFDKAVLNRSRFQKKQLNQCFFSPQQLEQIEIIP